MWYGEEHNHIFWTRCRSNSWLLPESYADLDPYEWVVDNCSIRLDGSQCANWSTTTLSYKSARQWRPASPTIFIKQYQLSTAIVRGVRSKVKKILWFGPKINFDKVTRLYLEEGEKSEKSGDFIVPAESVLSMSPTWNLQDMLFIYRSARKNFDLVQKLILTRFPGCISKRVKSRRKPETS